MSSVSIDSGPYLSLLPEGAERSALGANLEVDPIGDDPTRGGAPNDMLEDPS